MCEFIELHQLEIVVFLRIMIGVNLMYHIYNAALCFKYEDAEPGLLKYCLIESSLLLVLLALSFMISVKYFVLLCPIMFLPTITFKFWQRRLS